MTYRPITDFWILARCKYKGGIKRYGGYPGGFLERARVLLGARIHDPVLHVCGGLVRAYPYRHGFGPRDKTLDLDPALAPDYLQSALAPLPGGFTAALADPPYSVEDARRYAPGEITYPSPRALVANMLQAVIPGGRVGLLHYVAPRPPPGTRFLACVAVLVGFENRARLFSVYERPPGGCLDSPRGEDQGAEAEGLA